MPLQPVTVGCWIDRSHWPHHVTVCPEFHSGPQDIDALAAVLRRVAATTSPPSANIGEEAHFGPNGETLVQLVESNDLHRLHVTLMEALGAVARVEPLVPEYNSAGFRPHMTVIEGRQLGHGTSLSLGTLLLVEIAPDGDRSMAVPVATATVGVSVNDEPVSAQRAAGAWSMLDGEGIHSWVIGGWGVDALVGRQTRDHHDLDLLVLDEDLGSMLRFLETMGSGPQYLWSENRWHDRQPSAFVAELAGIEIDVHVIGFDGDTVRIVSHHSIELPAGALTGYGHIAGQQVSCANLQAQLVMHAGYDLPEKQLHDLELLHGRGFSP